MTTDERTFIKLHDGMPEHPKIEGLSDRAFRLLVESWCWSSRLRTDGEVPRASWAKRGTPAARRELVAAGLVHDNGADGVRLHDYLEHQRSAAQVAERSEHRRRAGARGNHNRHHVGESGTPSPECPICVSEGLATASQVREQTASQPPRIGVANGSHRPRKSLAETEESLRDSQTEDPLRGSQTETDLPGVELGGGRSAGNASATATTPRPAPDQEKHETQPCGRAHDPDQACRRCGDARRAAQDADAEAAAARADADRVAQRVVRECPMCDTEGWLREVGRAMPVSPYTRCDHLTDQRQQVAAAKDEPA